MIREKKIQIEGNDLHFSLYYAKVLQYNKYSTTEVSGGGGGTPARSEITLHNEITFQLTETNEITKAHILNIDLQLYTGQEVVILVANNLIVAYIDLEQKSYHLMTTEPSIDFEFAMPKYITWLYGLIGGLLIIFLTTIGEQKISFLKICFAFVPYIILLIYFRTTKNDLNSEIMTEIDNFMQNK
jgi:hypothetical protein